MTIALFAGTFDPPTLGHLEIIQRAALLCGKLYVAVANSNGKHSHPISQNERIKLLEILTKSIKNVEIITLKGLVVDCAEEHQVDFLIRGLRNATDLDYEMQMGAANRLMTGIETFYLVAAPEYSHINSTLIREIAGYGRHLDGLVPKEIEKKVFNLLSKKK